MEKKYVVQKIDDHWKVWNTERKVFITNNVPTEEIANEIAEDFNAMDSGDYSSLDLPDFSKN